MNAYRITDQKEFTTQLLLADTFDNFLTTEAVFVTAFTSQFSGRYTEPGRDEEFIPWRTLRPVALQLIKGKQLPKSIRIVLKLNRENTEHTLTSLAPELDPASVAGLYLNIRYDEGVFTLVTGTSFVTFQADRSLDAVWGQVMGKFLTRHGLDFEIC